MLNYLPILDDLPDLVGKRVLVRADLNVPLTQVGDQYEVADDFRIKAAVPTLVALLERGAIVTVCSHLGRPKGQWDARYCMAPVARRLSELVEGVSVMENLRFDPGEEANDPAFAARLVEGQDFYVNDAFGSSHRAHASIVGPPSLLPSAAGLLLAREATVIGSLIESPARPFCAVVGGAKVADKLGMLGALAKKVDSLLIGGGMCFTFLAALGNDIGSSLVEPDLVPACRQLIDSGAPILLPVDLVAISPGAIPSNVVEHSGQVKHFGRDLPKGWTGVDIGRLSATSFACQIESSATVLWNGPMGVFEHGFATGTHRVALAMANTSGFTVVGGGDTVAALRQFGLESSIDHLSTGGGATLELIEKGDLPGLAALRESGARFSPSQKISVG